MRDSKNTIKMGKILLGYDMTITSGGKTVASVYSDSGYENGRYFARSGWRQSLPGVSLISIGDICDIDGEITLNKVELFYYAVMQNSLKEYRVTYGFNIRGGA